MATNQTEHYGLSQWEPEDSFLREEFNQDHRKIDAALAVKCEVVIGKIVGTGAATRDVELGFQPKAVYYEYNHASRHDNNLSGGLAIPDSPLIIGTQRLTVTATGFQLVGGELNMSKAVYNYIAFR